MSWEDILRGQEDEDNPHIQTFREKGAKTKDRLKIIGEKRRKKGTKSVRDYPLKERSLRRIDDNGPIAAYAAHYISRVIQNIVTQTDESGASKLFDDHPDDHEKVWKDNPKIVDMEEGRLTLDQLWQQSKFEYPEHFEYKHTFLEEKEKGSDVRYYNPIKIPDDILAKVSNKANWKVTWESRYESHRDKMTFAETVSELLEWSRYLQQFLEQISKSLTNNLAIRYTKPGFLSTPKYSDETEKNERFWGIDNNGIVYVVRSLDYKKEKGPKIYPTVTRQGKEQILSPDDRLNRPQGDVPEKVSKSFWRVILKAFDGNPTDEDLKDIPEEYREQYKYEGETKELTDEFGETWTGTWDKEEGRYVEEVDEEESRSIIEGILELEGTNLSYEELVERFNEFMKNPTDMVEMPSELLEDEKARDDWFDAISQFKEDNV